jgi:hypothetical protein
MKRELVNAADAALCLTGAGILIVSGIERIQPIIPQISTVLRNTGTLEILVSSIALGVGIKNLAILLRKRD